MTNIDAVKDESGGVDLRSTFGSAVVERDILLSAVERISKVVDKNNGAIPVLKTIKLQGCGSTLELTASNLDIEAVARIPASADSSLSICINAQALLKLLKKVKTTDFVAIDWQGHAVGLDFGEMRVAVDSFTPSYHFPEMQTKKPHSHTFKMRGSEVAEMLRSTLPCVSKEETRYYLNGIYVEPPHLTSDSVLNFVATDGHRLCVFAAGKPDGIEDMPPFILPRWACDRLGELVEGRRAESEVTFTVFSDGTPDGTHVVRFSAGWFTFTAKTIEGTFPDYRRVLVTSVDSAFDVKRVELIEALEQVGSIMDRHSSCVRFEFSKSLTLSSYNVEIGRAVKTVPIHAAEGPDIDIGFNRAYVQSILESIGSEMVRIGMNDPGGPACLAPSPMSSKTIFVLMPMRLA